MDTTDTPSTAHSQDPYAPPTAVLHKPPTGGDGELASRRDRLFGALLDGLISGVVVFPLGFATGTLQRSAAGEISLVETLLFSAAGMIVFLLLHGYLLHQHGQTIGKRAVGTRIVSAADDSILPLWKVFGVRYLPWNLAGLIPVIGALLTGFVDPLFIFRGDRRCLHDLIAGTKVVNAKVR